MGVTAGNPAPTDDTCTQVLVEGECEENDSSRSRVGRLHVSAGPQQIWKQSSLSVQTPVDSKHLLNAMLPLSC